MVLCPGEFVVGQEFEARLSKTLLPRVTAQHLADLSELCRTDCSCVVKTVAHRRCGFLNGPSASLRQTSAITLIREQPGQPAHLQYDFISYHAAATRRKRSWQKSSSASMQQRQPAASSPGHSRYCRKQLQ